MLIYVVILGVKVNTYKEQENSGLQLLIGISNRISVLIGNPLISCKER